MPTEPAPAIETVAPTETASAIETAPAIQTVHPIETESYRRLALRVDLSGLDPGPRAVVARVIHASADLEYARTMVVDEQAVAAGVEALAGGAPIVVDVEMVRHGITGWLAERTRCYLGEAATGTARESTRSARAMELAAGRHPSGAVVVVGCAPTALDRVLAMADEGRIAPALVVGLPVGFVGAAEAKAALRASGLTCITNIGDKGGSAVAAAVVNALGRLAAPGRRPSGPSGPSESSGPSEDCPPGGAGGG